VSSVLFPPSLRLPRSVFSPPFSPAVFREDRSYFGVRKYTRRIARGVNERPLAAGTCPILVNVDDKIQRREMPSLSREKMYSIVHNNLWILEAISLTISFVLEGFDKSVYHEERNLSPSLSFSFSASLKLSQMIIVAVGITYARQIELTRT